MNKEIDLAKVNQALKIEFFDTQYKIGVLQKKLQQLGSLIDKQVENSCQEIQNEKIAKEKSK